MGVCGLETFVAKSGAGSTKVNIEKLIKEHKSKSTEPPVIVVDSNSITTSVYGKGLSWLNGGQLKEYREAVENLVAKFNNLGCHLVFFIDGPLQDKKIPTWKKRRINDVDKMSHIVDLVNLGLYTTEQIENSLESMMFPECLNYVFRSVINRADNCKVFQAINECDDEVVCYARKNKCFAILGQDTDYIIYNCCDHYFSMKNFNLETMTGISHSGSLLAKDLELDEKELPLLASLLGNDYVPFDSLKNFHRGLWSTRSFEHVPLFMEDGRFTVCINHKVNKVGDFIKNNRHMTLEDIAYYVFYDRNESSKIKDCISGYRVSSVEDYPERYISIDENWGKILAQVKDLHVNSMWSSFLYKIIVLNKITSSSCLEDYRESSPFEPTTEVLKHLRRVTYGVLLHEKPSDVEESNCVIEIVMTQADIFYVMEGKIVKEEKVSPIYLKETHHPGLLNLWNNKDEETEEAKWDILSEIFKLSKSIMKNIPTRLLIPVICLKYLKEHTNIEDWEVDVILSCSICVIDYSAKDLSKIPCVKINYRSIWLYTLLTRAYGLAFTLIQCLGEPVSVYEILMDDYCDGKLFHMKYKLNHDVKQSVDSLCENKEEHITTFNTLKKILND